MLNYLLEVTVIWSVLGGLYLIVFRRSTFYAINRAYLLSAIVLGLVLPLASSQLATASFGIPLFDDLNGTRITAISSLDQDILVEDAIGSSTWSMPIIIVQSIYVLGCILMLLKLILSLLRIKRLIDFSAVRIEDDYKLIRHKKITTPFSFFNYLFIPLSDVDEAKVNPIICHELIHINKYHSIDVMLVQLIKIVFWFHPMIWFYQYWIREVHEFEADDQAYNHTSKKDYILILIDAALSYDQPQIANHFYNNQLNKRIEMMYKLKSSKRQLLQYMLVLPALMLSVMMIGQQDGIDNMIPTVKPGESIELDTMVVYNPETYEERMFIIKYLNKDNYRQKALLIASGTGEFGKTGVTVKFGEKKMSRKYRIKSLDGKTDIEASTQDEELVVKLPTGIYKLRIDEEGKELYTTFEVKE